jgi:Tfp pilus assembly protein PilX
MIPKIKIKGAALLATLAFIILLTIVAGAVLTLASSRYKNVKYISDSAKTFYLAEAGLARAMYKIRTETNPASETFTFNWAAGSSTDIEISISGAHPDYDVICSTVKSTSPGETSRRISARVTRSDIPPNPTSVTVSRWQELTAQ